MARVVNYFTTLLIVWFIRKCKRQILNIKPKQYGANCLINLKMLNKNNLLCNAKSFSRSFACRKNPAITRISNLLIHNLPIA